MGWHFWIEWTAAVGAVIWLGMAVDALLRLWGDE